MNIKIFRTWVLVAATALLAACETPPAGPLPSSIVLQDPLPGQGVVYLIRAPHDGGTLNVTSAQGRLLARLPPETYTVLSLPPGSHRLASSTSSFGRDQLAAPPLAFELAADQRLFFAVAGRTVESMNLLLVPMQGGVLPLAQPSSATDPGTRLWKPYNELDARGLLTITRLQLPER